MVCFSSSVLASTILLLTNIATSTAQQHKYGVGTNHIFGVNSTWIENMAIRSNGDMLYTSVLDGKVYLLPLGPKHLRPTAVAAFGDTTTLTGITEVEDDVFYVSGIKNSDPFALHFPANASSVWKVDLRSYESTGNATSQKIADIPEVLLPNGMTRLSKSAGTILIADSALGKIWRFCVRTGKHEVINDDEALAPVPGKGLSFGVNGIAVVGSTMYFTNTAKALLGRFPIRSDGRPSGKPTLLASPLPYKTLDDFAVGPDGSVWLTDNASNSVVRVFPDSQTEVVAVGDLSIGIIDPVTIRFVRNSQSDGTTLLVAANGRTFGKDGRVLTTDARISIIDF